VDRKRRKRLEEFIAPFRVKPGSKVSLAKDFHPAFKAGVKKKEEEEDGAQADRPPRGGGESLRGDLAPP
jgi:hypothetical protein